MGTAVKIGVYTKHNGSSFHGSPVRDKIPLSEGEQEMDVAKILEELKGERLRLQAAIESLERLALGRVRGRGRPPNWMAEAKRRGRPPGSKNKTHNAATARTSTAAA
jgi:hypothetical protein